MNFIVVPFILMIIFIYVFFGKFEKNQNKLILCYVFHLVVLHTCLGVAKLVHHKLSSMPISCNILTYLSYYSVIACFLWICVMGHCSFFKIKLIQNSSVAEEWNVVPKERSNWIRFYFYGEISEGPTSDLQNDIDMKGFWCYSLFATAVPVMFTIIIFIIDMFTRPRNAYYCFRLQLELSSTSFYSFVPLLIIMMYGITLFIHIELEIPKIVSEITLRQLRSNIEQEHKRLVVD